MKNWKIKKKLENEEISEKQNAKSRFVFTLKILYEFHDFVSECVSFQRKINNPFWRVSVFFQRKVTIFHST